MNKHVKDFIAIPLVNKFARWVLSPLLDRRKANIRLLHKIKENGDNFISESELQWKNGGLIRAVSDGFYIDFPESNISMFISGKDMRSAITQIKQRRAEKSS